MSAVEALKAARTAGIQLRLDGDDLVLEASAPPPAAILDLLSRHKPGVVVLLRPGRDGWSAEDWQVFFDEQARTFGLRAALGEVQDGLRLAGPGRGDEPDRLSGGVYQREDSLHLTARKTGIHSMAKSGGRKGRPVAGLLHFGFETAIINGDARTYLIYSTVAVFAVAIAISFVHAWFIRWITEFAVTDRRVIYKRGFISRHTVEMNMDKIESVNVDHSCARHWGRD